MTDYTIICKLCGDSLKDESDYGTLWQEWGTTSYGDDPTPRPALYVHCTRCMIEMEG